MPNTTSTPVGFCSPARGSDPAFRVLGLTAVAIWRLPLLPVPCCAESRTFAQTSPREQGCKHHRPREVGTTARTPRRTIAGAAGECQSQHAE